MSTAKNQLLQRYTAELVAHPLRTKAVTAGVLSFLQEILASHLAGVPSRRPTSANPISDALASAKVDSRAFKMAAYGFLVSAPLGHFLVGKIQQTLQGRKLAQILANNLIVAPIQTTVYLTCMALISGARSIKEIKATVKGGFMAVMRITWMTSPLAIVFAQKFIAPELWVPFFNLVSFVLGTYFNTKVKKLRAAKEKKDRGD
ncbi:hypothetical protein M422DRAFT_231199 [Sphaerobolus stellatus SS14]|uniref:Uncharacterized protein n=1 Tax=Sphaerobolus stellatus (strain SS14) TaxID=990650 RepID=A0A0C9UUD6_SPHS4|nr:hypothetical protein M422DRAFT_231199 [Sphaerobolus stellatus SS14]